MRTPTGQGLRRWRQLIIVVATASIAILVSAGPAAAHNVLVSSDPAADAVLAKAPGTITLVFDQDVQNVYAEMAITIGSQPPVEFTPTVDGRKVTADLAVEHLTIPATRSGSTPWKIGYRIVSADGHPVTGLVNFSVGIATSGVAEPTHAPLPGGTSTASTAARAGSSAWLLIGAGLLVAAAAAAGLVRWRRRGATGADPSTHA